MYMDGVDKLNAERESKERSMLLTLEENLDYVPYKGRIPKILGFVYINQLTQIKNPL